MNLRSALTPSDLAKSESGRKESVEMPAGWAAWVGVVRTGTMVKLGAWSVLSLGWVTTSLRAGGRKALARARRGKGE